MKISIITISYNSQKTIEQTLKAVKKQKYSNIEHIIVDGKSTDNTIEICKKYPHISKIISEPDINYEAGYLLDEKYKSVGEIIYGDSIVSLNKFDKKIDLFINDSDHSPSYEYQEYQTIKNKLNK